MSEKSRSPYHCHLMSDKVKEKIADKSKKTGLAQWIIVEKILEGALLKPKFNAREWLKNLEG